MRFSFLCVIAIGLPTISSGQQIQDVNQLVGKKVMVQRAALCEPGTYNAVLTYAGKQGTVLSTKPSNSISLSPSVLARLTPQARALIEDQQKAAVLILQFEDGKKLDTCSPISPARISQYFELAEGETIAPPATPSSVNSMAASAEMIETLSDEEVRSAMAGTGKNRFVQINDAGLMAAQGAWGTLPHITLFMPDAVIAAKSEEAKKQFLSYEPSAEDRKRSLMVFAQGYIGKTYQEGCISVTRIVLVSSPSGGVVEEAYSAESGAESWANAFGATNQCGWLRAKFSLAAVRKVQAAAQDREFCIAVFAGSQNTKTYKIKHKHQEKLGLN